MSKQVYILDSSDIEIFSTDNKELLVKELNSVLKKFSYSSKGSFKIKLQTTTIEEVQ